MGSAPRRPLVLNQNVFIYDLLREVVSDSRPVTELIICSTRDDFIDQLISYIHSPSTRVASRETGSTRQYGPDTDSTSWLQPTLQLLSLGDRVQLTFCPTISIFRAQFARLIHEPRQGNRKLLILNLLLLHHDTSEFTLQGLSRTFALIASLSFQLRGSMELIECVDIHEGAGRVSGAKLWDAEVPLLSGSVKIKEAGVGWARRLCPIKRMAARWFDFQAAA